MKINKEMNKNMKILDICKNAKAYIYNSINCKFMLYIISAIMKFEIIYNKLNILHK